MLLNHGEWSESFTSFAVRVDLRGRRNNKFFDGSPMVGSPMVGSTMIGSPMAGSPMVGSPMVVAPMVGSPG